MHIFYDDRLAILVRSPGSGGIALLHGLLRMLHPQMTWQRALIFSCVIFLVLAVVQIIMFSDLECDYINPIDLCNKLNQVRDSLDLVRRRLTLLLLPAVCFARKRSSCDPHSPFLTFRTMDGLYN
jgi:hypothetical protein